jgi:ATP-dependent RNA helicase SUPV3L1/SUV3
VKSGSSRRTARYFPVHRRGDAADGGGLAFVALDEAQLAADRERGHIFTDRLLHARGREETMLLGAATMEPVIKTLLKGIEIEQRPRFSTLTACRRAKAQPAAAALGGGRVLGRAGLRGRRDAAPLPRRRRGGHGRAEPETRNRQVALFQSGEVDYIVATDAIGMGLNLDVTHVAFASLSKFDGVRQRRLTPAEMAQIAGRAGRHQQDGTFGTLAGGKARRRARVHRRRGVRDRGAPLRAADQAVLARGAAAARQPGDAARRPRGTARGRAARAGARGNRPRGAQDAGRGSRKSPAASRRPARCAGSGRLCQLPDFRQQGPTCTRASSRGCGRTLREGTFGADYVAARISELGRTEGDIDTLQGRIAAIRSWAYICQRPDWVLARDEMAARARAAEARLSDALHQRLTERFRESEDCGTDADDGEGCGLLRVALDARRGACWSRTSRSAISRASASWSTPMPASTTAS